MRRIISTMDTLSGAWRFEGTRLAVDEVVLDLKLGMTPERMFEVYGLTREELNAAVAWHAQQRAARADRRTG